jgi:hypothetical protein
VLEECGYGRRITDPIFDMVGYGPELGRLLGKFGITYERALVEMTTYPFWAAFHAVDLGQPLPGTSVLPRLKTGVGRFPLRLQRVGRRAVMRPRFCPDCLELDLAERGEPYWRRSHQIPSVLCCTVHQRWLLDACESCGTPALIGKYKLAPLLVPRCSCGSDLRRQGRRKKTPDAMVRLAQLSCAFLGVEPGSLWGSDFSINVQRLAHERKLEPQSKVVAIVEREFGGQGRASAYRFPAHVSDLRAPDYCYMLAALGLRFEDAVLELSASTARSTRKARRQWGEEVSLDEAKVHLLACRGRPSRDKVPYWVVRLLDPDWLDREFPGVNRGRIPSLASDRDALRRFAKVAQAHPTFIRNQARNSAPGVRARCRDGAWLKKFLGQVSVVLATHRKDRAEVRRREFIDKLTSAVNSAISRTGRPERLTLAAVARIAGVSQSQAQDLSRLRPELRKAVHDANRSLRERQIQWAVRQLLDEGSMLSLSGVASRASLPTTTENARIIWDEISKHEERRSFGSKRAIPKLLQSGASRSRTPAGKESTFPAPKRARRSRKGDGAKRS